LSKRLNVWNNEPYYQLIIAGISIMARQWQCHVITDTHRGRTEMTAKQQRIMFYSAAIFNWCACLIFFAPLGIAASLDLSHSVAINDGPFDQVALMAIALFGLGYWMVARNPDANRGIVLLGLIGKLAVVAIFFGHYFLVGDVNFNLAGLTIGDIIYSWFFLQFLRSPAISLE
jgi:hypothetical protein